MTDVSGTGRGMRLINGGYRAGAARAWRSVDAIRAFVRGIRYGQALPEPAHRPSHPLPADNHNPLEAYFEAHREGPGIWKWRHYFGIYHRHLAKFVGRPVQVVEIGVYSGGSLEMWRHYFGEQCRVYAVDIDPACTAYGNEWVRVLIGDQADPGFWQRFRDEVPAVDVVIDDGGHQPSQQVATLEGLLPHIRPGGVYVCEDVHGVSNVFHGYVDGLSRLLHRHGPNLDAPFPPTPFQQHVGSVHRYPFAVVIEKAEFPVPRFESASRGTEWRPPTPWLPHTPSAGESR